tara:strand:+ start:5144 stop:6328 length:1185 start_codon:yes stop_codon:yes gene_type:complete
MSFTRGRPKDFAEKIKASKAYWAHEHWKYPETVGRGGQADNINFNSDESSEYAIERMGNIDSHVNEPYMMFEFMKIDEKASAAATPDVPEQISSTAVKNLSYTTTSAAATGAVGKQGYAPLKTNSQLTHEAGLHKDEPSNVSWPSKYVNSIDSVKDIITGFFKDLVNVAKRNYVGSVALYMPTDIQINDQMIYNEDTRRIGGVAESIVNNEGSFKDIANWTVLTSPEVLTGASVLATFLKVPHAGVISTLAGYGVGTVLQTELQRSTGKVANPNELLRYSQTALRAFTFTWTILPDNQNESTQATGLIKMFRKAAHATRDNAVLVTVPDHCIISFHGAKNMIQLPPCYIESVNVTYNPNNSSFFKQNNSPVEIGLGVTFKEIIPIYSSDIDKGF